MARKKVKLAWIDNDSARRATFKKRKKGLMKKVSELSTLCGVSACAIVYGPYGPQPEIWPPTPDVHRVLARFKDLPEMEQSKKMVNQEGFLRQRIVKMKEQMKKQQRENREYEMTRLMYQGLGGKGLHEVVSTQDLNDLVWLVEEKMKAIHSRIEVLRRATAAASKITGHHDESLNLKKCEVGRVEDEMSLEVSMEALQRQTWFKEVINSHDHINYIGDDIDALLWGY